jgi:hypothetical protein
LPFCLDITGEAIERQVLDQNLDARLVFVVSTAVAVVDPEDGLEIIQQLVAWQKRLDALANFSRVSVKSDDLFVIINRDGIVEEVIASKRTDNLEFRFWPFGD